jgi:hypothetical protein
MKKIIIILAVLFPTLAWSDPSIEFQTEKYDFGFVKQGEQLEFNFEFTNTGTDILKIEDIKTS